MCEELFMNDDVVEMKYLKLVSGKCSTILCVREIAMILPAEDLKTSLDVLKIFCRIVFNGE